MRTAWVVPVIGSIAQGVVVVTPGGLADRPAWALGVASFFGLLSGQLLWWRNRVPLLAAVALGYVVQALLAGPGLPVVLALALYSAT